MCSAPPAPCRNVSISSSLSSPRSRMLLTCRHDGLYDLVYQLRFMREHSQEGIVGCLGFTELADDLWINSSRVRCRILAIRQARQAFVRRVEAGSFSSPLQNY